MAKDVYRESPDGGYLVIKDDAVVGWVPAGHPGADRIAALESKGEVVIEPAREPGPVEPSPPEPTVRQLIAALIRKGVLLPGDIREE